MARGGSRGQDETEDGTMPFRRGTIVRVTAALLLLLAAAGASPLLWPSGIRVEVRNRSGAALLDVLLRCGRRQESIGSIPEGTGRAVWIRPTGESQTVEVAFATADGTKRQHAIHIYLESGYHGRLVVSVRGDSFSVSCAAKVSLSSPLGPWERFSPQVSRSRDGEVRRLNSPPRGTSTAYDERGL